MHATSILTLINVSFSSVVPNIAIKFKPRVNATETDRTRPILYTYRIYEMKGEQRK